MAFISLAAAAADTIRGLNWFGLETEHRGLMCDWQHPIEWHLEQIHSLGFTHLRIPFSYDYVQEDNWSVMDDLFANTKMNITLDFHRVRDTHQSPRPDAEISLDEFITTWVTVISRYQDHPKLEAVDIFNEFQSSDFAAWNDTARQILVQLEEQFPNKFKYYVGGVGWGGNVHLLDFSDMPFADRIFLTIHKYWFSDTEPLEDKLDFSFGLHKPVVSVGEWGFKSDQPNEVAWAVRFMKWLLSKGIRDSYFWTWTPNSGDTGGLLLDDCTTVDTTKMAILRRYWAGVGRHLRGI